MGLFTFLYGQLVQHPNRQAHVVHERRPLFRFQIHTELCGLPSYTVNYQFQTSFRGKLTFGEIDT
jgi:hypothetical protein